MLDKWDYCLRRLFVLKSKSLKSALRYDIYGLPDEHSHISCFSSHLAPGSEVLLKTITDRDLPASERVNVKTEVRKLEIREWANLVKAFDEWPFAPEVLKFLITKRSILIRVNCRTSQSHFHLLTTRE
jgi:transcription factor 1